MREVIYVQMKSHVRKSQEDSILLDDIARLSGQEGDLTPMIQTPIYKIRKQDQNIIVIDYFIVIKHLMKGFPDKDFRLIGEPYSIIKVEEKDRGKRSLTLILVWILLFIGAAMTIMNFHYDVSMQEVQQELYFIFTGERTDYPLLIQIPYSLGLAVGMLLFFNHWFKKKITDEPSPLEMELHNYQKQIDDYLIKHENIRSED